MNSFQVLILVASLFCIGLSFYYLPWPWVVVPLLFILGGFIGSVVARPDQRKNRLP